MVGLFSRLETSGLHSQVTRALAVRVIQADRASQPLIFPNEAELCHQLGVSRTIIREAVKVLADKGMVAVRPRLGTRARPRAEWNQLDPDILGWQAQLGPDGPFLRDLCEVRLAIEPVASGFAALRARSEEVARIRQCLEQMEAGTGDAVDLDLEFHAAVVAASHNTLLEQLSASVRQPFRTALSFTTRLRASEALALTTRRELYEAIDRRDPLKARTAAEELVGLAMIAVEQVIRTEERRRRKPQKPH